MVTCASCGRENPADARFCNGCGAPLAARAPRREERKVVTVLFADLVGFTSRAEQLDPEDVRALLASYWQHVRDELEHFGGTVEKFIGDAVMALFGAPVAHEDDPERAVRAALAIRDWARETPDVQVRIAVNTGEALVLLGSKPSEGEGMAAGDIVNTTARLQTAAPVNGVLAGELTYRATRHAIDYGEHEPVVAKGKSEPLPVWEAVGARSRFTVETISAAPLAGRTDEVELLVSTFQRVRRDREPQLVTVAGVPGIGKSRLVAELYAFVDADPELVTWRRGRSLSYGEGVSLWALGEIAKAELGVLESDTRDETAAKLDQALDDLVEDERERTWLARHLAPLVGLPAEQDDRPERFGAWRRWIELLADRRPLVLVFEDIQWADDRPAAARRLHDAAGAARAPARLGRRQAERPHGVARPAQRHRHRPHRRGDPRPRASARRRADHAARTGGRQPALRGAVRPHGRGGRAAGRAAGQRAGHRRRTPRPAIAGGEGAAPGRVGRRARVLAGRARRRRRPAPVARAQGVHQARAPQLGRRRAGVLVRARARPRRRLRADPAGRPRGEAPSGGRLDRVAAARPGRRPGRDGGPSLRRGPRAGAARGRRGRGAAPPSARRLPRGRIEGGEPERARDGRTPSLLRPRARRCGRRRAAAGRSGAGPRARRARRRAGRSLLEEAAAALSSTGDAVAAASAEIACARACFTSGQRHAADQHSRRALALLEHEPLSEVKVDAFAERARLLMLSSALAEAAELATAGLELAERIEAERPQASLLITRGTALGAREDIERGLAIAEDVKDLLQLSRGFNNLAELVIESGDLAAAFEVYARQRREFEQLGLSTHLLWLDVQEAALRTVAGAWDRALELVEPVLARLDAGSTHYLEGDARATRARIRYARGATYLALADAERGLAAARSAKDPQTLVPALGVHAELLAREGRLDEARALLDEALGLCRELPTPYYSLAVNMLVVVLDLGLQREFVEVFAHHAENDPWTAAAVLAWRGDLPGAADVLARHGGKLVEADVRVRAAARWRAEGDVSAADEQHRRALRFFETVGATHRIHEAGELLAATA